MAVFSELVEAQLDGAIIRDAALVKFNFKSGVQRLWQGAGTLDAGGYEWQGIGDLGAIEPIQSGPRGAVEEITLTIFGDAPLLARINDDADESVGREAEVFLQFFDMRQKNDAGDWVDWQPIDEMISLFWGRMGPFIIKRQAAGSDRRGGRSISVTVQSALVNRQRPAFSFFSDADQAGRGHPTDNIFSRMSVFSEGTVRWPQFGSGAT